MAAFKQESDDEALARQMAGIHIKMDESDDYVPNPQGSVDLSAQQQFQAGQNLPQHQMVGQIQQHIPPPLGQPQGIAVGNPQFMPGSNIAAAVGQPTAYIEQQQQQQQQITTNPTASPPDQPVVQFFGGFQAVPQNPPAVSSGVTIGSKTSFRSLQPKEQEGIPAHAYRSDPRNMSTLVDPQYTPGVRGNNEYLALIPNIYNPKIPMPVNVMPDETLAMYEALHRVRAEKERQKAEQRRQEDIVLYGGSTQQINPTWQIADHNLVTGLNQHQQGVPNPQLPPPPVVAAQVPQISGQHPIPRTMGVPPAVLPTMQPGVAPNQSQGMVNVPVPDNPVLAAALYQAMRDENTSGQNGLNMDDLRNIMLTQDVIINPKALKKDDQGSDSTIGSGSSSSSSSEGHRRRRCTIL